ncbi:hypothetical protein [Bacillus thuringiensis]|uniref:hypothetical protein n=1 Tax=Bacillus thuringiensis TaxID=1428 RepID=UPI000A35FAFE|nr:hypothetical protein [Bacillus thuringiensis]OUA56153.1 hypothetical protein BK781_20045 [Bacillus thuringiensis serovar aizawai]
MIQIKNFDPCLEVPYYIPCTMVTVHEAIKAMNSTSYLSLYPNTQMASVPTYHRKKGSYEFRQVRIWDVERLGYAFPINVLGFDFDIFEFPSFKEGIEKVKNWLQNNEIVLVTGSPFYTPYSKDYKDSNYIDRYNQEDKEIMNHVLIVYGINENEVLVYDPIPNNYKGSLSINDFKEFWKGDKELPKLKGRKDLEELLVYGAAKIRITKQHTETTIQHVFTQTLRTILYEYLSGSTIQDGQDIYYYGEEAVSRFLADLEVTIKEQQELLPTFAPCIQQMKYSRYFFRDFLKEYSTVFGELNTDFVKSYEEIVLEWEKIYNIFMIYLGRKSNKFDILFDKIETLKEKEFELLKMLQRFIGEGALLAKGPSLEKILRKKENVK